MKPLSIQAKYQKYPSQVPVVIGYSCSRKEMSRTLYKQLRWEPSWPNDEEHSNERVPRCCRKHFTAFWVGVGVHADGTDKEKFEELWVPINGVHGIVNHFPSRLWRRTRKSLAWRVCKSESRHFAYRFDTFYPCQTDSPIKWYFIWGRFL